MNIYSIQTPFNIEIKLEIASFSKRLWAWLIDLIAIYAYNLVLAIFIFSNLSMFNSSMDSEHILTIILLFIPSTFYHLVSQLIFNGRSLGKYVMNIKVVNMEDGGAATLSQIALRNLLCLVNFFLGILFYAINPPFFLLVLFILSIVASQDILSVLIQKNKQKIGDIVAGTIVVVNKKKSNIGQTIYLEVQTEDNYQFQYPQVQLLSDNEINGLQKILQNQKVYNKEYLERLSERIEQKIGTNRQQIEPILFFKKIIEEYNYYYQKK